MSGSIGVGTQAPKGSEPSDEPFWSLEAAAVTQVLTVDPHAQRPGHAGPTDLFLQVLLVPTFMHRSSSLLRGLCHPRLA